MLSLANIPIKQIYQNREIQGQHCLQQIGTAFRRVSYFACIKSSETGLSKYLIFLNYLRTMGNKVCGDEHQVTLNPNLKKGNDLYQQGKYPEALLQYNKAIQDQPDSAQGYKNRADVYAKLNQIPNAKTDLDKVIELDPEDSDAYHHRGMVNRELGNLPEAQSDYDRSIMLNPHSSEPFLSRGNLFRQQQKYQEAINDYTAAIELHSNKGKTYQNRGICYAKLGKHHEAVLDFTKVIEAEPQNGGAYAHRGYSYYQLSKHGEANYDYSKSLQLSGGSEQGYFYRGKTFFHQGKYPESQQDFDQAIAQQNRNPLYKFYLATSELYQNQPKSAGQHFEEGIALFQQLSEADLAKNYNLSYNQISFIDGELTNYSARMKRVEKLQNQSEMNGNAQILKEVQQLKSDLQGMTIPRITNVEVTSQNDDQKINNLETRVGELQVLNSNKMSPETRRILDLIKAINTSVFSDDQISLVIDGIPEAERREYYSLLYNFIVNHLLSYNVLYNGYYVDNSQNFQQISSIFQQVSFNQALTSKVPIFNELVKSPYNIIIKNQLGQKTSSLNKNVAHKVGTSTLNNNRLIRDNATFIVKELINNSEFNSFLLKGLNEDRQAYLKSIWDQVTKGRTFDEQKVFQHGGVECNQVQKVVVAHMILISKWFYEIDLQQFHKTVANQRLFYDQISKCLPPRKVTSKGQDLADNDFKDMGSNPSVGCCQSRKCLIM